MLGTLLCMDVSCDRRGRKEKTYSFQSMVFKKNDEDRLGRKLTSGEVFQRAHENRIVLRHFKKRRAQLIGYMLEHNEFVKQKRNN